MHTLVTQIMYKNKIEQKFTLISIFPNYRFT